MIDNIDNNVEFIKPNIYEESRYTPVEQMALGFCAWFILQHLRGYKPFVTIMEKEQILKFKI